METGQTQLILAKRAPLMAAKGIEFSISHQFRQQGCDWYPFYVGLGEAAVPEQYP
jgi:hypothetical protein